MLHGSSLSLFSNEPGTALHLDEASARVLGAI